MTEATLPGVKLHTVTFEQTLTGLCHGTCTCGWSMEGARQLVLNRAATHDLDSEPVSDCDVCGKPTGHGDLRSNRFYTHVCPTCRGVPTDLEIERSQRFLAALLGEKYP